MEREYKGKSGAAYSKRIEEHQTGKRNYVR